MSDLDLNPSRLGTKEYWDSVYKDEVSNFEEFEDEGEIWFGTESVEKMVDWARQNVPPSPHGPFCLDIGAGNGILSIELAKEGYDPSKIAGIDYSADAITLAKSIAAKHGIEGMPFEVCDFINSTPLPLGGMSDSEGGWDLLLDKGTFDAIALAKNEGDGPSLLELYPDRVKRLVKSGGFFLITSCNFTEEELKTRFLREEVGLRYHSRIQYPTFTFGGKTGSSCSSVAFQKI